MPLEAHLRATVTRALELPVDRPALVVYDRRSPMASRLADAYRAILLRADMLDFDRATTEDLRAAVAARAPGDLVALVQSSSFRVSEFRFRLELFRRHLVVIEHSHVARIRPEEEATYVAALAYDPGWYRAAGPWLKAKIDAAAAITLYGPPGAALNFVGPFEPATLNVGDYRHMTNRGGLFPIGEVFTEASDLRAVNGSADLFAFADIGFCTVVPPTPVRVVIEGGLVVDARGSEGGPAPEAFLQVLDQIRADEQVMVRELGFGLNRALTRETRVTSIGAYERMCGVHLSLGHKHTVYSKRGRGPATARHHVDVFVALDRAEIDGEIVYAAGAYRCGASAPEGA